MADEIKAGLSGREQINGTLSEEKGIDGTLSANVSLSGEITMSRTLIGGWNELTGKPFKTLGEDFKVVGDALELAEEIPDISGKADKATTLEGYGITDAYTKEEIDSKGVDVEITNRSSADLVESADGNIVSLHMFGSGHKSKNLLNATTKNGTLQGINYVHNDNGTYTFNGTTTANANIGLIEKLPLDTLPSRISFGGKPNNSNIYSIWLNVFEGTTYLKSYHAINGYLTKLKSEILNECPTANMYQIGVYIQSGISVNNEVIKPMVVNADLYPDVTYDDYEPYGIITSVGKVESGKLQTKRLGDSNGNYTTMRVTWFMDDNGISDERIRITNGLSYAINLFGRPFGLDWSNTILNPGSSIELDTENVTSNKYIIIGADGIDNNSDELMEKVKIYAYVSSINASEILDSTFMGANSFKDELIVNADGTGKYIQKTRRLSTAKDVYGFDGGTYKYVWFNVSDYKALAMNEATPNLMCNVCNTASITNNNDVIGAWSYRDVAGNYYAVRVRPLLGNQADLETYLENNTIEVVYTLYTPIERNLTVSEVKALLSLETFKDYTLIKADCEADIEYYKNNKIGQTISDVETKFEKAIPTLNNAALTIKQNGVVKGIFTANSAIDVEVDLEGGGGSGGASKLSELSDVVVENLNVDDTLTYDPQNKKWKNGRIKYGTLKNIPTKLSQFTNDVGVPLVKEFPTTFDQNYTIIQYAGNDTSKYGKFYKAVKNDAKYYFYLEQGTIYLEYTKDSLYKPVTYTDLKPCYLAVDPITKQYIVNYLDIPGISFKETINIGVGIYISGFEDEDGHSFIRDNNHNGSFSTDIDKIIGTPTWEEIPVQDAYTKSEIDTKIGDVEALLAAL